MYQLRPYQQAAVDVALSCLKTKKNGILVLPTGAGKSFCIAEIARQAGGKTIILQPTKEILEQNLDKMQSYGAFDIGIYSASMGRKDVGAITFATIGTIIKKKDAFLDYDRIIVDECDRCNSKGGQYEDFINHLDLPTIGLTATPYRMKNYRDFRSGAFVAESRILTRTRPRIFDKIIHITQVQELYQIGFLSPLNYSCYDDYDSRQIKATSTEQGFDDKALELYNKEKQIPGKIIGEISKSKDRHILAFTPFVSESDAVVAGLKSIGISCATVSAQTPKKEREYIIDGFRSGEIRCVINVGVLCRGFDYPELDCIILGRPTKSVALYYQMCLDDATEILTKNGWKGICDKDNIGEVAAYNIETESIIWEFPLSCIHRKMGQGEKYYGITSPTLDIAVTDQHDMIIKRRVTTGFRGVRRWDNYKKVTAHKVSKLNDIYKIPIAGFLDTIGVPLTDDELRFIGWVMTDGNVNKYTNGASISQGEHQPWVKDIEKCLIGCGFKYNKFSRDRINSRFKSNSKCVTFTISFGAPRGRDKHLRGWGALKSYLSKDLSINLFNINRKQLSVMLEAIHLGDGSKQLHQTWTRRSYHIATGNKVFAERLQILCITRGFKCNMATHYYNKNLLYMLHIKDVTERTLGGAKAKDRPIFKEIAPADNRWVWCVQVSTGAIMVRRNGKVSIVGNCGRGIRPAPGKVACNLIDLTDNVKRFGKIETFELYDKEENAGMWRLKSNVGDLTGVDVATGRDLEGIARRVTKNDKEGIAVGNLIITFGKFNGKQISEVPTDYLKWAVDNFKEGRWKELFKLAIEQRTINNA